MRSFWGHLKWLQGQLWNLWPPLYIRGHLSSQTFYGPIPEQHHFTEVDSSGIEPSFLNFFRFGSLELWNPAKKKKFKHFLRFFLRGFKVKCHYFWKNGFKNLKILVDVTKRQGRCKFSNQKKKVKKERKEKEEKPFMICVFFQGNKMFLGTMHV